MHAHAAHLHVALKALLYRVCALKKRQQRRVQVYRANSARKNGGEDTHKARKHGKLCAAFFDLAHERGVELLAASEVFVI